LFVALDFISDDKDIRSFRQGPVPAINNHSEHKFAVPRHALPTARRNTNVKLVEPPSCSATSKIVFIGRSKSGNWIALEQNGLYGGMFVRRAEAFKYALFENGRHPETIVELSREIELDMNGAPHASERKFASAAS
jgi:hypothetical protein